jgi:hypothetical protein
MLTTDYANAHNRQSAESPFINASKRTTHQTAPLSPDSYISKVYNYHDQLLLPPLMLPIAPQLPILGVPIRTMPRTPPEQSPELSEQKTVLMPEYEH